MILFFTYLSVPFLYFDILIFLMTNLSCQTRSPPQIPEVILPEDIVLGVVSAFRIEINTGLAILRDIASGRDLKKFLAVSLRVND